MVASSDTTTMAGAECGSQWVSFFAAYSDRDLDNALDQWKTTLASHQSVTSKESSELTYDIAVVREELARRQRRRAVTRSPPLVEPRALPSPLSPTDVLDMTPQRVEALLGEMLAPLPRLTDGRLAIEYASDEVLGAARSKLGELVALGSVEVESWGPEYFSGPPNPNDRIGPRRVPQPIDPAIARASQWLDLLNAVMDKRGATDQAGGMPAALTVVSGRRARGTQSHYPVTENGDLGSHEVLRQAFAGRSDAESTDLVARVMRLTGCSERAAYGYLIRASRDWVARPLWPRMGPRGGRPRRIWRWFGLPGWAAGNGVPLALIDPDGTVQEPSDARQ